MRDRQLVALADAVQQVALKPVGLLRGVGCDDQFVCSEDGKRVLDRLERVGVADSAFGGDTASRELADGVVDALPGVGESCVGVGHHVSQP